MNSSNDLSVRQVAPRTTALVTLLGVLALLLAFGKPAAAETEATYRQYLPLALRGAPTAAELLAFDWNGPIREEHHGMPSPEPPLGANGDWTRPIDYAGGVLHLRVEVRSMPQPQRMRLQLCFWQDGRETCTRSGRLTGQPGTVVTWSQPISRMWSLNNHLIDWARPRRTGIVVRDGDGDIVSDYGDGNWAGHDPDGWFPLDIRFTAVVVARDGTFSGWHNYVP